MIIDWEKRAMGAEARLAEVEAERDATFECLDANWTSHQQMIAMRQRAEAAEARIAELEARHVTVLRKAVDDGYLEWARKPHNDKWVRKIDGTPIPNDIVVCIQQSVVRALQETPK